MLVDKRTEVTTDGWQLFGFLQHDSFGRCDFGLAI